jgi:hypothetical protein
MALNFLTLPGLLGSVTRGEMAEDKREMAEERLLKWFNAEHLPDYLESVTTPFYELARYIVEELPPSAERTVCLRKLLEARDAAFRAHLEKTGDAG